MTEINIRNIILIGRTGNGKSTVANVISGTDKFKEGKYGVSETRDTTIEEVDIEGIKYRIIDTVGIGDTILSEQKVLNKIAEAVYIAKDGLNQIFFVTNERFTKEEIEVYDILRKVVFDKNVGNYTAIIKTKFPDFGDEEECEKDVEIMTKENKNIARVIRSCRKIIHVDNPSINIKNERKLSSNKEDRENSRKLLITYLASCIDVYKPNNLDGLNERVGDYVSEKEQINKLLEDKNLSDRERAKLEKRVVELEEKIASGTKGFFETVTSLPGKVLDKTFEATIEIIAYPFKKCNIS